MRFPLTQFSMLTLVFTLGWMEAVATGQELATAPVPSDSSPPISIGSPTAALHACRKCDPWYVALSGGTATRDIVHEIADSRTFIEFRTGFAANVALGYRFERLRLEAEYSFMNNECAEAGAGGLSSPTTGNVNLRALMFNAYRDFQFSDWCWKPYLGGGLGVYQSEINSLNPDFFNTIGAPFAGVPVNATSDTPFAYQFRVGASRPLGERAEFFTGYRFFHGETLTFASAPFASFGPTFSPDAAQMHNAEFGLRVRF
ncbi:MAG: outer membrane beta-barrel protein [Pirellulaceae bacterium]|nr:outer membrane beta-barrel protein [Pirellulaceae bacterium]